MATLQVLYKVKTAKVFDKSKCRLPDSDDDPFAIQHIQLCLESRLLVVAGITHVILFRFSKQESSSIDPTVRNNILLYKFGNISTVFNLYIVATEKDFVAF